MIIFELLMTNFVILWVVMARDVIYGWPLNCCQHATVFFLEKKLDKFPSRMFNYKLPAKENIKEENNCDSSNNQYSL